MRKMKLQRFADDDGVVVVDVVTDDPTEPIVDDAPLIEPPPAPMPSRVSREAWENVEELLVTLSNNVRSSMGEVLKILREFKDESSRHDEHLDSALAKIGVSMDEFNALLAAATVETEEQPSQAPSVPSKVKSGYLNRKRGR